jgi:hypothetical protein
MQMSATTPRLASRSPRRRKASSMTAVKQWGGIAHAASIS